MSSMEQQDERRILGQMVRFQNQAAVRIHNDCVNGLGGTSLRSQGQDKENKAHFHVPLFETSKPLHVYATLESRRALPRLLFHLKSVLVRSFWGEQWPPLPASSIYEKKWNFKL